MKSSQLIAIMLASASSAASANPVTLREDCVEVIKNSVAAAAGAETLDDTSRQDINISNVRVLGENENSAGTEDYTYRAHVKGQGLTGTVVLTATRGGCLVQKLDLHATYN